MCIRDRIDAVQFLIVSFNLSPRIEEVIRGEEGTVFIICTIARVKSERRAESTSTPPERILYCYKYRKI